MVFIIAVLAVIVAFSVYRNAKKRVSKSEATFAKIGTIVALFIALIQLFTVIPAGSVGVVDFLGTVSDNTLKAGVNIVNPLANIVKFTIKTRNSRNYDVPSKEGLSVQLELSLLYHLNPDNASRIYKTVGENYQEIIIVPQFRS